MNVRIWSMVLATGTLGFGRVTIGTTTFSRRRWAEICERNLRARCRRDKTQTYVITFRGTIYAMTMTASVQYNINVSVQFEWQARSAHAVSYTMYIIYHHVENCREPHKFRRRPEFTPSRRFCARGLPRFTTAPPAHRMMSIIFFSTVSVLEKYNAHELA